MSKKKWLTLGAIGAALLLIPRRSSRQTMPATTYKPIGAQPTQKDDESNAPRRSTTKD